MNKRIFLAAIAALTAIGAVPAKAQDAYPSKPVRILVGYAPGGSTDTLARLLAKELTEKFKQPFVVENKPGANTVIAAQNLLAAPSDGYTLAVFENTTPAIAPFVLKKQPYDPKSLQPITKLVDIPLGLQVPANSPFNSLKDFMDHAKANKDAVFGSSGAQGASYLQFETFLAEAGLKLQHVAYKGAAPAIQDLVAGHLPAVSLDIATGIQHIQAGKVKVLAVTTPERLSILPNVRTYKEQGFPSQVLSPWFGVFSKAGTPPAVVDKLNAALQEIANSQGFKDWAKAQTLIVAPSKTPAEFANVVNTNIRDFSRTIEKLGISAE